ncbi:MAG: ArsR family transcriptional regulator [Nocardioides sp.]
MKFSTAGCPCARPRRRRRRGHGGRRPRPDPGPDPGRAGRARVGELGGGEPGLPRQKVNYHLRTLERHGLVELVEERPRRGLTERVVRASARGYVVAPPPLGRDAADPARTDRLSARYVIALAARVVREVATLSRRADAAGRPLATLALDADIRFASAADRAAFTQDLAGAVAALTARYHDESAPGGRWHRLVVAAHPRPRQEHADD